MICQSASPRAIFSRATTAISALRLDHLQSQVRSSRTHTCIHTHSKQLLSSDHSRENREIFLLNVTARVSGADRGCLCSGPSSAVHLRRLRFLASAFHIAGANHQYAKVTYTLTFAQVEMVNYLFREEKEITISFRTYIRRKS